MRVMVIGASRDPEKYGHRSVVAHRQAGHTVFPVNPHAAEIAGVPAFADIASVPGPIDRVSVYRPPEADDGFLEALARRGDVSEVWLNPGSESPQRIQKAKSLGLTPVVACSIAALHAGGGGTL